MGTPRCCALFLCAVSLLLPAASEAQSARLVGFVYWEGATDALEGATVQVFDAVNAEIVATGLTSKEGSFDIGGLSPGTYRVRFWSREQCVGEYFDGGAGQHLDVFSTALEVPLRMRETTAIQGSVVSSKAVCPPPIICNPQPVSVSGWLFDAESETKDPAPGISVRLKNAVNAVPYAEVWTDSEGHFSYWQKDGCGEPDVKLRFVDPAGFFLSEYFGASGADGFEWGEPIDLGVGYELKEGLARNRPDEQVADLQDEIEDMELPEATAETLQRALEPVESLLSDDNPNNDVGACGVLRAFVSQVERLLVAGDLLPEEADALMASVNDLKENLGCP